MAESPISSTASSPVFSPKKFTIPITYKLTEDNYLLWQQEALAMIKGQKLQSHLQQEQIPQMYLSPADSASGNLNPAFSEWEQQDNVLLAWLLNSLSETIRVRMVGCVFSYQVWAKLQRFFTSQTRAKISQLKTHLRGIKKGTSMNSYLLEIKKTVDQLGAVGAPLSAEATIEAILEGLPSDYNPIIASILSRLDPYTVDEIEALLMAVEARIERCYNQDLENQQPVQAHFTQARGRGRSYSLSSDTMLDSERVTEL